MSNYEKMAAAGADLFLEKDQDQLLARYPLQHDDTFIYVTLLGEKYRIERSSGCVLCGDGLADPREALIVLDMVCNNVGAPVMTGTWCSMAETSGASNSPGTSALFDEKIATFTGRTEELRAACEAIGGRAVAGGEVSFEIEVFEGFRTWLQFWDADDEFPAQLTFLWDKSTRLYLHFETLWYIMYSILDKLIAHVDAAD